MEQIMSLLDDFDLLALLPDLQAIFSDIRTWVSIALMLGPLALFVMGLLYLILPPKEANHRMGFRTYFGMGSVEAWRFTQRMAGIIWGGLGLILLIVFYMQSGSVKEMEVDACVMRGLELLMTQIVVILSSWVVLHILPAVFFNRKGYRRWGKNREQKVRRNERPANE